MVNINFGLLSFLNCEKASWWFDLHSLCVSWDHFRRMKRPPSCSADLWELETQNADTGKQTNKQNKTKTKKQIATIASIKINSRNKSCIPPSSHRTRPTQSRDCSGINRPKKTENSKHPICLGLVARGKQWPNVSLFLKHKSWWLLVCIHRFSLYAKEQKRRRWGDEDTAASCCPPLQVWWLESKIDPSFTPPPPRISCKLLKKTHTKDFLQTNQETILTETNGCVALLVSQSERG